MSFFLMNFIESQSKTEPIFDLYIIPRFYGKQEKSVIWQCLGVELRGYLFTRRYL